MRMRDELERGNPWYVGKHFEWAERDAIRRIYAERLAYFLKCIKGVQARIGGNLRFLDAGCGDGYWLARLGNVPGLELYGFDANPLRVQRAKRNVPQSRIWQCDITKPAWRGLYDVILLSQVIEHVPNDEATLKSAVSSLSGNGVLIVGTTNEGSWMQRRLLHKQGAAWETDHVHLYTETEIRKRISRCGLTVASILREVFFPGNYRLFYALTRREWGFRFLQLLTRLWPSGCSDFYFECRPTAPKNGMTHG